MPTFPTLTPAVRTWTPGDYLNAASVGISGRQANVRISNAIKGSELRLEFMALTQSELNTLIQHYNGQQGSYQAFGLVSENWIGVSNPNNYTLSGYLWRYAEPPKVEDYAADDQTRFNVSVKLASVPSEGMALVGAQLTIRALLTAGAATGSPASPNGSASGASLTVTATLAAGTAASAFDGLTRIVTVSLLPGYALTDGQLSGFNQSIQASFTPGTASNGSASTSDYWSDFVTQLYEPNLYLDWWGL